MPAAEQRRAAMLAKNINDTCRADVKRKAKLPTSLNDAQCGKIVSRSYGLPVISYVDK